MTDEELKALVASNARAIQANTEAIAEMRRFQEAEAQQWRAGIEDTMQLITRGQHELGEKIDGLGTEVFSRVLSW